MSEIEFITEEYQDEDGYDRILQSVEGDDREIFWTYHPMMGGWEAFKGDEEEPFWWCKYWPGNEEFAAAWQAMVHPEESEA